MHSICMMCPGEIVQGTVHRARSIDSSVMNSQRTLINVELLLEPETVISSSFTLQPLSPISLTAMARFPPLAGLTQLFIL